MHYHNNFEKFILCTIAIAIVGTFVSASLADTIQINPLKDNTLYNSSSGSLSNGTGTRFFAGRTGGGGPGVVRALVNFEVAGVIPAGSTINSVQLEIGVAIAAAGASNRDVSLHKLLQDWGEGDTIAGMGQGGGGPALASDATWIHTFYDTATWNNAGGDFIPTASASETLDLTGGETAVWSSTGGMIDDVQSWLDNSISNFGWILIGDESLGGTAYAFDSRESNSTLPTLIVDFTPVPEPGSLLLCSLSCTFFISWRNHCKISRRNGRQSSIAR